MTISVVGADSAAVVVVFVAVPVEPVAGGDGPVEPAAAVDSIASSPGGVPFAVRD